MILDLKDIKHARVVERGKSEPAYKDRPAEIVAVDGSTAVSGAAGYVWVREYNVGSPAPALNEAGVITEAGTPVIVRKVDKPLRPELHIVGLYTGALAPGASTDIDRYEVGAHRENHQWPTETTPSKDPVRIYQPALMPLKTTYDSATMTVGVNPLFYALNGGRKYFPGQSVDLTSYIPATAGQARRVLLYLDTATNQITIVSGGVVAASLVQPPFPDCPAGGVPSAYITLTNGDTAISAADYVDARQYLSPIAAAQILNNYAGFFPPTANDDKSKGYAVGSFWMRTNGDTYRCYDATAGAAQWRKLNAGAITLGFVPASGNVGIQANHDGVSGTIGFLQAATTSLAGVMTAADKTKLDGATSDAVINPNTLLKSDVNGRVKLGGVQVGSPTGGDLGAGTINAAGAIETRAQILADDEIRSNDAIRSVGDSSSSFYMNEVYTPSGARSRYIARGARGTESSPSPLLSGDIIGDIRFDARYSTTQWALNSCLIRAKALENQSGSNRGAGFEFYTIGIGNTGASLRMKLEKGLVVGGAAGGDQGAGTINVQNDIYKNATAYTNPDYALEAWVNAGKIKQYINNTGAEGYRRLPLKECLEYVKAHYRLPRNNGQKMGMFQRSDWLLEKLEEAYTYIFELHQAAEKRDEIMASLSARLDKLEMK